MAEEVEELHENSFCRIHPAQSAVGICSVCLQEKLGKLVFSERQSVFSQQSDMMGSSYSCSSSSSETTKKTNGENVDVGSTGRVLSLMDKDRSKQQQRPGSGEGFVMLSRSKTVATSRRISTLQETNRCPPPGKKKGSFWSFLYFTKRKSEANGVQHVDEKVMNGDNKFESEEGPHLNFSSSLAFEGKVMRSRSVGYGSRSFSAASYQKSPIGGFKDCRSKRVESKGLEGEQVQGSVKCGGLFVGFGGAPTALISDEFKDGAERTSSFGCHSRSKSWSWAFSSPLRAFIHSKRWTNKASNEDTAAPAGAGSSPPGSLMEIDRG